MVVVFFGETCDSGGIRKLKAHKKSRKGCGNCKLRKIKCDETRPHCEKCKSYGTICSYEPANTKLQPVVHGNSNFVFIQRPLSQDQMVLGLVNSFKDPSHDQYTFSSQDLGVMYRFHTRTILTLGPTNIQQTNQYIYSKLTYPHPFLFHCVLTLTIVHDQYLGVGARSENAAASSFHWSRAAALLNERLSVGPEDAERDAIWACAALLGALAFCSVEGNTPEEVWPLSPSPEANLDWLRLTEGKKEIWNIADPTREDSIYRLVLPHFLRYASPNAASTEELKRLPPALLRMCKFHAASMQSENPYYNPVSVLAQTLDIECNRDNVGRFLSFFGCMSTEYKRLLQEKDPCAMLILAYWYAKVCHSRQWYLWRRTYLECQAICKYLLQHFENDADIVEAARDVQTKCAAEKPWRPLSQLRAEVRTLRALPA